MKISILGSGMVGQTLGTKLVQRGHQVMMGSRNADNDAGNQWKNSAGKNASTGTFADAARLGDIVLSCTNGAHSLDALRQAGAENLHGKILVDISNPLDFSHGMPPTLTICNTDSLAEQIQREFTGTRVVKALNTMNCKVMADPSLVPGDHSVFICGNDPAAKMAVTDHLGAWFGWKKSNVIDLGEISAARGTEMTLPLWLQLWNAIGHPHFNFHIVVGKNTTTTGPQG